jgi:hypothetical protein
VLTVEGPTQATLLKLISLLKAKKCSTAAGEVKTTHSYAEAVLGVKETVSKRGNMIASAFISFTVCAACSEVLFKPVSRTCGEVKWLILSFIFN